MIITPKCNFPKEVYLSGGMQGYKNHNIPMFFRIANMLRQEGIIVHNPPELDNDEDMDIKQNTDTSDNDSMRKLWLHMMKRDIKHLISNPNFDGIVLLPNWNKSSGAKIELYIMSELLGVKSWELDKMSLINDELFLRQIKPEYNLNYSFITTL